MGSSEMRARDDNFTTVVRLLRISGSLSHREQNRSDTLSGSLRLGREGF